MQIIPLMVEDDVAAGDDIGKLIVNAVGANQVNMKDHDIVVVTQKIISKSEGRVVNLSTIDPSDRALNLANRVKKDPRFVELVISESKSILRCSDNVIISETKHGFVCANSGIDQSNVIGAGDNVLLLPVDPDLSARQIRHEVIQSIGRNIAVIVTDTFGRPFRLGQTNVAIGVAGIDTIKSYVGKRDMYGNILRITEIAVVDEIASAAELVMGKNKRVPIAIVRGYGYSSSGMDTARSLVRDFEQNLFR